MSDSRFIKFIPSEEADYLQENHPNAFLLLSLIAKRARRIAGKPDGLEIGEAHIGDYWKAGIESERKYRTAKSLLELRGHIKICETCRTRKSLHNLHESPTVEKATTKTTTKGTLVKLLNSDIWEINIKNETSEKTTERRPSDDEQDISNSSSIQDSISKKSLGKIIARSPAEPRPKDSLTFNFSTWNFEGIAEQDKSQWQALYPHLTLDLEISRAAQWVKANPSKSKKKLWRKFITGWFERGNDKLENKKAFKVASGGQNSRLTTDINGVPVKNTYEGKF
jgi:hypothetical protein